MCGTNHLMLVILKRESPSIWSRLGRIKKLPVPVGCQWPVSRPLCKGLGFHSCDWFMTVCMCMLSHSVMSHSWWPHGLQSARLLCPRDSPGKSTGVGCHFPFLGIFPDQGLNLRLLHCRWILLLLSHQEAPHDCSLLTKMCWGGTHVLSGKGRKAFPKGPRSVGAGSDSCAMFGFRRQEGRSLSTAAVCTCVQGRVYRAAWGTPHHSAASLDGLRFHFHLPEGHLHVFLPSLI